MKINLRLIHQLTGIITMLAFIASGVYMASVFPDIYRSNEIIRFLFRSSHIYILLSGLLNLGLAGYVTLSEVKWRRRCQIIGTTLIIPATIMLIAAFFYEPANILKDKPLTMPAIVLLFLGTISHWVSTLKKPTSI